MNAQQVQAQFETTFRHIQQQRMQGVPLLNERLQVKAVDFRRWQEGWLGVLVTPWFMNLIYQPDPDSPVSLKVGEEILQRFPSGRYTFVVGHEEGLGFYQSCSLFSPMFEFEDQAAAELTARNALIAVLDERAMERLNLETANPATDETPHARPLPKKCTRH